MCMRYVGKNFCINDAAAKARGELKYTSDLKLQGMLYLKLILSQRAHAVIKSIDTSKALSIPGVTAVFSYKDFHAEQYCSYRTFPDQELCDDDRYIFSDKVRFVGDIVAVVAADSADTAEEGARLVDIQYEDLPVAAFPEESIAEDACQIHEGKSNLVEDITFEKRCEAYSISEPEAFCHTSCVTTQKMNHLAIETHCYLADYCNDELTIWTPTQGIFGVRTVVADMLSIPYNRVRVIKTPMGGSFGGKQEFIYEPLVAFVAKKLRRPVKLHLSRRESIIGTIGRSYIKTSITTSFTGKGELLSCSVDSLFDGGAYIGSSLDQLHAMKGKIPRLYRMPVYKHRGRLAYTNTPIAGGMRGWGSPEMMTVLEIHMALAARKMKMDSYDLHMKNLLYPEDIDMCCGLSIGNGRVRDCLEMGASEFKWKERSAMDSGSGRIRRGVGFACGSHKNGMYYSSPDLSTMTMRLNEDGSISMQTSVHDVGCGTVRSMQIIVGEVLSIHPDKIQVTEGDTKYSPYDCGSYGSRVTFVSGECARRLSEEFKELLKDRAAQFLSEPAETLVAENESIGVSCGKNGITYKELATRSLMEKSEELIVTYSHKSGSNPGSYAVNFAEVEVDTCTGLIHITDFLSVNDVGRAINREMVHNQIAGGVQMALGYGVCEDIGIKSDGTPSKASLRRYQTFNAADMPRVTSILVEDGEPDGPFGAKSVGEISTVPGTAAIVNAVNNALGTSITKLPLTPERIIEAFQSVMKAESE